MALTDTKFNLATHQRAERKKLATVVEWQSTEGRFYVLQESEPADWSSKYTSYYTKSDDTYTAVTGSTAPTWAASTYYTRVERELLGRRTEDSSIEYNPDIETSTDILGINYADVNKTQPSQEFSPHLILGGSRLSEYLNDKRRRNAISEISNFTAYIITLFIGDTTNGYATERHSDCTITYDSLGGESNVDFPITVHYSNDITVGTIDEFKEGFTFTPETGNVG